METSNNVSISMVRGIHNDVSDLCQPTYLIKEFNSKFIETGLIPPIGKRIDDYRFYEEMYEDSVMKSKNPCTYQFLEWLDLVPDCEYEREHFELGNEKNYSYDLEATQIIHAARWIKANPGKEVSKVQYFLEPHIDIDTSFVYQTPGL
jgi:hypothetical protein